MEGTTEIRIDNRRFAISPAYSDRLLWHCHAIEILEGGQWLHWDDPICTYEPKREDAMALAAQYLMRYCLSEDGDIR